MTLPSDARRRPPGRYDPPSLLGQRVLAVLLAVLVVAFVAAAADLLRSRFSAGQLRGEVVAFRIPSDEQVVMDLQVSKPEGARAYCVVRARDRTGVEVGRDVVVVDAEGSRSDSERTTFVLETSRRAVTAEIAGCTSEPISRPTSAP